MSNRLSVPADAQVKDTPTALAGSPADTTTTTATPPARETSPSRVRAYYSG